jgi:hypothetical protein
MSQTTPTLRGMVNTNRINTHSMHANKDGLSGIVHSSGWIGKWDSDCRLAPGPSGNLVALYDQAASGYHHKEVYDWYEQDIVRTYTAAHDIKNLTACGGHIRYVVDKGDVIAMVDTRAGGGKNVADHAGLVDETRFIPKCTTALDADDPKSELVVYAKGLHKGSQQEGIIMCSYGASVAGRAVLPMPCFKWPATDKEPALLGMTVVPALDGSGDAWVAAYKTDGFSVALWSRSQLEGTDPERQPLCSYVSDTCAGEDAIRSFRLMQCDARLGTSILAVMTNTSRKLAYVFVSTNERLHGKQGVGASGIHTIAMGGSDKALVALGDQDNDVAVACMQVVIEVSRE